MTLHRHCIGVCPKPCLKHDRSVTSRELMQSYQRSFLLLEEQKWGQRRQDGKCAQLCLLIQESQAVLSASQKHLPGVLAHRAEHSPDLPRATARALADLTE